MDENQPSAVGDLLLEIGTMLMSSGANTNRIRYTILRVAKSYGYQADYLITHRAIMLTLTANNNQVFNKIKQAYALAPNFRVLSGLSRMSWQIVEEKLSLQAAYQEIERLRSLPHYPRWLILTAVALACSAFCRLAGGNMVEMAVVFVAAFTGLFVRQEFSKKKVNAYFTVFFASFTTTMISGGANQLNWYTHETVTLITSILYLIPGIPLINSMTDILDGYSLNGLTRAINGFVISFAIAAGLLVAILIYNLG